jgi:hypothetical protein
MIGGLRPGGGGGGGGRWEFIFHHSVQTGSGAHPAFYPTDARGSLSLVVKRLEREADHSPPSSAEVRMRGAIRPFHPYAVMAWCSVKAQGQLHLYLLPSTSGGPLLHAVVSGIHTTWFYYNFFCVGYRLKLMQWRVK